jgi:hypothetical protein
MVEHLQPSQRQRVGAEDAAIRRRRFAGILVAVVATAHVAIYLWEPRPGQQTAAATQDRSVCGPTVDAADCRCALQAATVQTRFVAVGNGQRPLLPADDPQVDSAAVQQARNAAFAQRVEACRLSRTSRADP